MGDPRERPRQGTDAIADSGLATLIRQGGLRDAAECWEGKRREETRAFTFRARRGEVGGVSRIDKFYVSEAAEAEVRSSGGWVREIHMFSHTDEEGEPRYLSDHGLAWVEVNNMRETTWTTGPKKEPGGRPFQTEGAGEYTRRGGTGFPVRLVGATHQAEERGARKKGARPRIWMTAGGYQKGTLTVTGRLGGGGGGVAGRLGGGEPPTRQTIDTTAGGRREGRTRARERG